MSRAAWSSAVAAFFYFFEQGIGGGVSLSAISPILIVANRHDKGRDNVSASAAGYSLLQTAPGVRPRTHVMPEEFECRCIYVEVSNESVPRSGRLEYRARSCEVCRARGALQRVTSRAAVAFGSLAPRYQRMH